jgi:prepilin-type N-terminal cleavage/methylation domain-containing protein
MLAFGRFSQKGDTLIEVLFAVTVFSLVAVGSLSIMNQGTTVAQRSLETTLVRQEIDAQAETLRFVHDSYIAAYPNVVSGEPSSR